ncbi:cysteine desulfurase [Blastopirellula retiformator]|uniref:cysteine desulfurase n=1 Tax=Blastopirellula retiformator TaxID=2527970 RepID=A0A5C5UWG1_9BACT|nr:cysteine desulfurase [Blastopirellula retiformator]TWT29705.1 putative cysteine desulfurase [Blastopirellula retiformator]
MNVEGQPRIYLDNAATSWPKPPGVVEAMRRHLETIGAPAGRSGYHEAAVVERALIETRRQLAYLFGLREADRVVFTFNGTDSLNTVMHGYLREGDHVVATTIEHNSVLRPLAYLAGRRGIEVRHVAADELGVVTPAAIEAALTDKSRLIVISHASNVTGAIQPIEEITEMAHRRGVRVLVDGAQAAGHIPLRLEESGVDFYACSGHKGLLGPLGVGILYFGQGAEQETESFRQGGTGTLSQSPQQPDTLPDKYESGNPNVTAILGLQAAVEYLRDKTVSSVERQIRERTAHLLEGLAGMPQIEVYGPRSAASRVGVVSLNVPGFDPHELASFLDSAHHVQVRAGLHCSPLIHQQLGTSDRGGAVRFSVGAFTTAAEIEKVLSALGSLVQH